MRIRGLMVLWVAAFGGPATAHAQADAGMGVQPDSLEELPQGEQPLDPKKDREARDEFEKGRVAYDEGRYRDAWGHFHRAYTLSKRPKLLYNVGQTADRLGKDEEALKSFRLYLKHHPDAENRKEVENRVRALEERVTPREAPTYEEPTEGEAKQTDTGKVKFFSDDVLPEPPPAAAQPRRKEWYFRFGLGAGGLRDMVSDTATDLTVGGLEIAGEFAIGHEVAEGMVLGGGIFGDWAVDPKVNGAPSGSQTSASLTVIGPMGDWYLAPRTDGWHIQAGLGLAALPQTRGTFGGNASGFALNGGGGYEWNMGDDWGMGVLGRITFGFLSTDTHKHTVAALAVMASATHF